MDKLGVVIVAGGNGTRMGSAIPKQFIELCGKPILMHCMEKFKAAKKIVVVLPDSQINYWQKLCKMYDFKQVHSIVSGGDSRFYSVKNGLSELAECDYIAVQDGVRPFVSERIIEETLCAAHIFGAAIPVIKISDSLREITNSGSIIVPRDNYRAVQTPQIFKSEILLKAYLQEFTPSFTDDASVVEAAGYEVALTRGDLNNLKITTPIDLMVARQLIEQSSS